MQSPKILNIKCIEGQWGILKEQFRFQLSPFDCAQGELYEYYLTL